MQVIEAWAGWQASGLLAGPLHDQAVTFMLSLTDALHEAGLVSSTMRFACTTKELAKRMLKYYRIS